MIEITERVAIDRSPGAVFDQLARIESLPAWLPPIRVAERLDTGPIRAGSRARLVIAGPTGDIRATGQITMLDPGRTIAFRTRDAPARIAARCDVVATGMGGTELLLSARIELPGLLRFGEGMVRERILRELPAALVELRARLESAIPVVAEADPPGDDTTSGTDEKADGDGAPDDPIR